MQRMYGGDKQLAAKRRVGHHFEFAPKWLLVVYAAPVKPGGRAV